MNFQNHKVYESPDGGQTIYERDIGSSDRTLIKENTSLISQIREDQLWGNIRRQAKTNKTLADILDQAKMVYALIKKENN
jgi:hypothetical protein